MNYRRARALATIVALTAGVAAISAPAVGEGFRTETGLGGFSVKVDAAPFKVLVDDPAIPLPRPEGEAIVEADPAFTSAEVATGPVSRGLASTLWPGNLLGNGLAAASGGRAPAYPVVATARYPDQPYVADDPTGGDLMHAEAAGLESLARASVAGKSVPGAIDLGGATSMSTAVVDVKHVAIGRSVSKVTEVDLFGAIKVGSVSTVIETRSDGKTQTSSGRTVVSGLSVAGMEFVVDEQGAHPAGSSGTGPLPLGQLDPLKQAGITIGGIAQTSSSDAEGITREASGLRITIDTALYRKALTSVTPGPVTEALYQLFGSLPLPAQVATYRSFLYYPLSGTPKITFIVGAGTSFTVANLPLRFDVPSFPAFPGGPSAGVLPPPSLVAPGSDVGGDNVPAPVEAIASDVVGTSTATPLSSSVPAGFGGIGAPAVLGALLGAGLLGWGLRRLKVLLLEGAPLSAGCGLGAPSSVPDLQGDTA